MKRSIITFLTIFAFLAAFSQTAVFSQEATDYSFGTVSDMSEDTIVIEEVSYDGDTGEETTTTVEFDIAPDVELEGIESLTDLKPGVEVEIEYIEQEGKKKAVYIYSVVTE